MGQGQASAFQPDMTDEAVEECLDARLERRGLGRELRDGAVDAVSHLHFTAVEPAQKLYIVVARHAERLTGCDHIHDDPQHVRRVWSAIDEVADKAEPAAG